MIQGICQVFGSFWSNMITGYTVRQKEIQNVGQIGNVLTLINIRLMSNQSHDQYSNFYHLEGSLTVYLLKPLILSNILPIS